MQQTDYQQQNHQQMQHQNQNSQQQNPQLQQLQQLTGQSQDLLMMQAAQAQTRQNQGHQDGQRSGEPRERLPSVYVGNLPKDYYQLDLYKHVKMLGYNIFQAVINTDKQTKRQNRYGFLQFFDADEAKRCAEGINNTAINGQTIRSNFQEGGVRDPKANVLVRNISLDVTQQQLYDAFTKYGGIKSCKLEQYPDGKSRGFGYIQFESSEIAEKAIQASGDLEFQGKKVEVLVHQKREERKGDDINKFYNIFVQKLPAGTDDDKLQKMFGEFGEITSAHVQRGDDNSQYKDFGYVSFKETESASAAVESMNKKKQDDGTYLLVNQHISKRENEVAKSSTSGPIQNSMKKTYESNLFVKNIPAEITEDEVIKLFAECGPVMSVKLRQGKYFNPSAAYRQYFVLFQDIEGAKAAIQKFDQSTPFGARALSVQFWVPGSELHAEREQRSFQQIQQYFMKNFNMMGSQGGNQMMGQDGRPMQPRRDDGQNRGYQDRGQGGRQYQNNYQGGGGRGDGNRGDGGRGDGGYNQRRGGQDGGRGMGGKPYQSSRGGGNFGNKPVNRGPGGMQPYGQQQMPMGGPQAIGQQQPALVDLQKLSTITEPEQRRQEIGNGIYPVIQQTYGQSASKITGMLLDNDQVVDPLKLVTDINYLNQKAFEAHTLLQENILQQQQQMTPDQIAAQAAQAEAAQANNAPQ